MKDESPTFLDALVASLQRVAGYNRFHEAAPTAILWPDSERQWESVTPLLRERLPVFTFGLYTPNDAAGPASWLRYTLWNSLAQSPAQGIIPVVYMPSVSIQQLRSADNCPHDLKMLYELRYSGVLWTQANGQEWTIAHFLSNKDEGLGVEVRTDTNAHKTMLKAMMYVADLPVSKLREEAPWKAADFEKLLGASPPREEINIRDLIAQGEGPYLEFKSTARWNIKAKMEDKLMGQMVYKTVGAFLNSQQGGILLIGVEDDGTIHGLDDDYQLWTNPLQPPNPDRYAQWLTTLFINTFGREFIPFIELSFAKVDGKDVCKVAVRPAPRPAYARDGKAEIFYARLSNATEALSLREAVAYIKDRWG